MSDSKSISWTWTELINAVPDAEEVLSSIFNGENLQEIQSQQSPPPPLQNQNTINPQLPTVILLEETEEEQKKKKILIKNRASAARSRARKLERIKFLEEQVETLKEENAKLKRIILEETLRRRCQKIQVEMIKETTAKKLKEQRRTVSS
ncbi:hypothetical protein CISIN_1g045005mg [Citrus sinensis]|uniref:BZIP domain-containing protein n=1 Tax=Citrus sinensis TaxID=2711 RepID=A0A067ESJ3_CITSI|nr:hypothetical protein CISIN_1g045005mg [Citrus sinensis]